MKKLTFSLIIGSLLFQCQDPYVNQTNVTVPDGYKIEQLLAPKDDGFGSWVSLAHVKGDRFIASDQYGDIYWIDVPKVGSKDSSMVSPLGVEGLGKAQGLLWAYNSLFVMVNDQNTERSGLYRVTDSDGDGSIDKSQFLKHMDGWGEHGPHAVILGPDGYLYVISGNHTDLPEAYTAVQSTWEEDRIFESVKDPNGHARDIRAPGGWIAKTDTTGQLFEVVGSGFRNAYDIAFNGDGELFTFDSDMEWDLGLPWYRPVRVNHVTSGAEFGWRTGSGKWPVHYPDNLPGVVDVGQGSPTGIISATQSNFPAPFDKGLFINDWSFGTMYHVALKPAGATYSGELTEFLSGVPLPLTDIAFGEDGSMLFTTGGRRLESGLFRVWYDGTKSSSGPVQKSTELKKLTEIEAYHNSEVDPNVEDIWNALNDEDRFIRYAARIAIENQGISRWESSFESGSFAQQIGFAVGAARAGDNDLQSKVWDVLATKDVSQLSTGNQLELLRAQGLLIIRGGFASKTIESQWESSYPNAAQNVNLELANLFATSSDANWFKKTFDLFETASEKEVAALIPDSIAERSDNYGSAVLNARKRRPAAYKIGLMDALSRYERGWTNANRNIYFNSFNSFWDREGGFSYRGFLLAIMDRALTGISSKQVEDYKKMAGSDLGFYGIGNYRTRVLADLPVPEGPGQNWSVADISEIMEKDLEADLANGAAMFDATLCRSCHSFKGSGSNLGPDLTNLRTRFSIRDIATAMVDPNLSVSDQYMFWNFETNDGREYRGKIVSEANDTLTILVNPLLPDQTRKIAKSDLKSSEMSDQSIMFPALLNRLNEQEVFDLMSYLTTETE